jgi:hypothetical protein
VAEYVVLIYEDEKKYADAGEQAWQEVMRAHQAFPEQVEKLGAKLVGGHALQPPSTATRIADGAVTDGPFVETKEALGGYYLIEADDLDTALAVGRACPARFGGVEVRPWS